LRTELFKEVIMASATLAIDTLGLLAKNPFRKGLINELNELKDYSNTISREQVKIVLGQWFHPLHYFPVFLSRLVAVAPEIEMKTFISRILWQELGEGTPEYSHEKIYIDTMVDAGFKRESVALAQAFDDTEKLLEGYRRATEEYMTGLGFLYATEVADLAMVSTIGQLVRGCTGKEDLPWIDIHVQQEPHHVECSSLTLQPSFTEEEQSQIVESAQQMWMLWTNFFKAIKRAIQ
jgi:hypothetical protein